MNQELEVIDAEVEDLTPAVAPTGTLFRTEDPAEIIRRATELANELKRVLVEQKLTKRIGTKDHVLVDGWSLLGTMLGVFPVCVWTRKLDNGWEARVEARTLSGAVVGAAEAECLNTESLWKGRDDYALRSMAQTRATSKALRQPLGFVVSLAGFSATPAEEMPNPPVPETRVEGPGALALPKTWAKVTEMVSVYDETTHDTFMAFGRSASNLLFGTSDSKELTTDQRKELLQTTARAALALREAVDSTTIPGPTTTDIRKAWASVLDGQELALEGEE